jgi:hypothetical protein
MYAIPKEWSEMTDEEQTAWVEAALTTVYTDNGGTLESPAVGAASHPDH